ncbi:tyrosine-type recombinase/integrase [Haloplanus halophilus]|uniref:tyrosine-type recombinase/integrase n=1 Tax=Haloplanus halophilus TaxID=2949993 RepID=UPI00203C3357|nr:tyrosine-type recombinase/integrase [Haloplanus sp. GDY1]
MTEQVSVVEQAIDAHHSYKAAGNTDTAREYRRHIRRFVQYLEEETDVGIEDCHSGHVEDFYQHMLNEQGYAPSSIRVAHAAISDLYSTIEKFGENGRRGFPQMDVGDDPTEHATPERIDGMFSDSKKEVEGGEKPLEIHEVRRLVNHVPAPTVRNELIVRLLYQTGIRRSELVRIKISHIDRDSRKIAIYGKKTDESRTVWYHGTLDSLLSMWLEADRNEVFYAEESEYLFPTRRQVRMDEQTVTDVVTTAAENAGLQETVYENRGGQKVKRVGAHTLRKSFGVHFINDGGDISLLADLLGHDDIETTKENYLKYSDTDLQKSVRRHGPHI